MPVETVGVEQIFEAYVGSIHPQGWVPVETQSNFKTGTRIPGRSSIHPQGWVPVETHAWTLMDMTVVMIR